MVVYMEHKHFLRWVLSYAKRGKKDFFLYCLMGILMVVVWLILPIIISKQTLFLTGSSFQELYRVAFLIFGLRFFYSFLKYFISYHAQRFITATYKNLHLDIIQNFLNIKYDIIHDHHSGFYIDRMTSDTIDISDFLINITDDLIDLFINIGSLITIFMLNKILFLFYVYFLLLLFLVKQVKTKRYAEEEKKKRANVDVLMNHNIEIIRGVQEIKLLNLKNFFQKKVEKDVGQFNHSLLKVGEVNRFFLFITNNVQNIFRLLLVSLSIYLIMEGHLSISIALVAINYENSIFGLLDYSESLIKNIRVFRLAAERILEILDPTLSPKEQFGNKTLTNQSSPVFSLQNVSFHYEDQKSVISQVSFDVLSNHRLAFAGKSGCGKTTLFYLLTKLYDPTEGHITFYGTPLINLKEQEIRKRIAVVSQTPYLFHMTVRENLKLTGDISDQEMMRACKIAQIHDDILTMKEGYNTLIQEGGSNLSGGQRQRLAIARALLQNTPILLLDEATSALDNDTQKKLQESLKTLKGKTIITIAHRLSTIRDHDNILVFDDGTLVASGSHKTLLEKNAIYQNLYKTEQQK